MMLWVSTIFLVKVRLAKSKMQPEHNIKYKKQQYSFWANLVKKIEIVSLMWNSVPRLI